MRIEGKIIKWKEDRGFGFLAADQGGAEVFAHITAFPRTEPVPTVGEPVSFEIETEASGKKRAKDVRYLARSLAPSPSRSARTRNEATSGSPLRAIVIWLAIALVLAAVAYKVMAPRLAYIWQPEPAVSVVEQAPRTDGQIRSLIAQVDARAVITDSDMKAELKAFKEMTAADPIVQTPKVSVRERTSSYQCDGRQHCSQMRTCDEAKYFVRNCPNTKMDGDGDGIPCEEQWCSG